MKTVISNLILILLIQSFSFLNAQELTIRKKDASETTAKTSGIKKLYFQNGNLLLKDSLSTISSFLIDEIQKLYFNNVSIPKEPTNTSITTNKSNIGKTIIYPNPASNIIYIGNLTTDNVVVKIFNLRGQNVLTERIYQADNSINIGLLETGLYFLRINGQTLKFIKK